MIIKKFIENLIDTLSPLIALLIPLSMYIYTQGGVTTSYIEKYVLTNGDKIIVFQGMIHIGLQSYYKEVGEEINEYRNSGYKIYKECFKSDQNLLEKDDQKYLDAVEQYNKNKNLTIRLMKQHKFFTDSKYALQAYALIPYTVYDDECADLNEDTVNKLKTKLAENYDIKKDELKKIDDYDEHLGIFAILNRYESVFICIANLFNSKVAFLFFTIMENVFSYFDKSFVLHSQIIMDARNKNLVDTLINNPNKNIYVSYGNAHFIGFFQILKSHDSKWRIVEITNKISLGDKP